ncbi:MAG: carboxypeptidase regulatory-like domain-containing protein, partial [Acidobacteriales bacterium]
MYRQNDFGATLGGPVYIPKLYNGRNRTFLFGSYEGFRNREGATASYSTIPTPEMYKGDFSRWVDSSNKVLQIYDPATTTKVGNSNVRTPFSGNLVPLDRFTAFAKSVIPYAEPIKPNAPGIERGGIYWITNNYVTYTGSNVSPQDKGSLKVDHMINQSHRLAYFMNFTRYRNEIGPGGPTGLPVPLYSGQPVKFDSDVYRLTHDWTLSPTTLNHFVVGGNLFDKLAGSPNSGINWQEKGVCIKGAFDCTINFPIIEMSGYSSWGGSAWNGTEQPLWSIKEDLSHIRGQHSLKFGYSYQSQRAFGIGFQRMAGLVNFNRLGTSVPAQTANQSGSGFASFLLGQVNSARTQTKGYIRELYQYHGFYAQDDWRINRRLVLNLGLRYEFTLPPVELDDQYSDFDPTLPNPAVNGYPGALRFAGFGPGRENTRRLVPGWYKGFGPRLGMAFSVNQKTTLRAAFGRSFDKVNTVGSYGNLAGFVGQYDGFATSDQGITPAFQIDQGFPAYPLPPQINPAFQNNQNVDYWHGQELTRAPEELFWTFSINRQLTSSTVLEASYNAVVGVHLRASSLNINQTPTKYLNEFIQK